MSKRYDAAAIRDAKHRQGEQDDEPEDDFAEQCDEWAEDRREREVETMRGAW